MSWQIYQFNFSRFKISFFTTDFKILDPSLIGVAKWVGLILQTERSPVWFLIRERQLMFLSLSFSLPPRLSKNKKIKSLKKPKKMLGPMALFKFLEPAFWIFTLTYLQCSVVRWHFIMILIRIFLMITDVEGCGLGGGRQRGRWGVGGHL